MQCRAEVMRKGELQIFFLTNPKKSSNKPLPSLSLAFEGIRAKKEGGEGYVIFPGMGGGAKFRLIFCACFFASYEIYRPFLGGGFGRGRTPPPLDG